MLGAVRRGEGSLHAGPDDAYRRKRFGAGRADQSPGLESITALNDGLIAYPEVVLFASHDHEFVATVANRIIEITPGGAIDRVMTLMIIWRARMSIASGTSSTTAMRS